MRSLAFFLGLAGAVLANPASTGTASEPAACLDTLAMRRLYRLGELEDVYWKWRAFFQMASEHRMVLSRDCIVEGSRMVGMLGLILEQDSVEARRRFLVTNRLAPRKEMWDLSLPMAAQAFWDHYVASRRERTDEEVWQDKWLPPISEEPAPSSAALALRSKYHSARLLYAQALDLHKYDLIVKKIAGLQDPAFMLLRADVALRMGEGPTRASQELDRFHLPSSVVISEHDAVTWRTRLGNLVKRQKEPIQPRDMDTLKLETPVLKEPPRAKR